MSGLTTANIASVATLLGVQAEKPAVDLGSITGGTISVLPQQGTVFTCTMDANVSYVTWSGGLPEEFTFTLIATQGASGPFTFAHALTAQTNGTAIDPGDAAGETMILIFKTLDVGNNWYILQAGGAALS